ncbi:glycosyltransferase family 2 protein [bacterium]|nr:glycosyltransferase family 2 protein [bacterium]
MPNAPRFNYIITIHNKEDLIEEVLKCVLMCCRDNSHVYPVLDGCTDNTEKIVDGIIKRFSGVPITKIHTPDVHELLSINAGLRAANQEGDGFNIVLQDDVLLADFFLEKKVTALYEWSGPQLGYVSFRIGANFTKDAARIDEAVPYTDYIENVYGHGLIQAESLMPGYLAYRTVPIKSPVCIPFKLIQEVGMFEERLAPYGHDDPEYAIRLIKAGYRNAVFALCFYSDVRWGGTRVKPHPQLGNIVQRNMKRIREWHGPDLENICAGQQPTQVVQVPYMVNEEECRIALDVWKMNVRKLKEYQSTEKAKGISRIQSFLKRVLKG